MITSIQFPTHQGRKNNHKKMKRMHTVWKSLIGSTPSEDNRAAYGRITSKIKLLVSVASLPIGT